MIFFPGLLIYAIVALIVQKKATLGIFICEQHRKRRTRAIITAWIIAATGLLLLLDATITTNGVIALIGVAMSLGAGIFGIIATRLLVPSRIDDKYAYLKGADPAYLDQLQEL